MLLGLTFAGLNAKPVVLNYYVGTTSISLSLLLVLCLGLGMFIGVLVMLAPICRSKQKNRRLTHRVTEVEQELENLRSLPIKDSHKYA